MKTKLLNAYFAGLIDGEGTINAYYIKSIQRFRPVVKVDMTHKETIERLAKHFGGKCQVKKTPTHHKQQWRWEATHASAVDVCEKILPYLITKAENARHVLTFPKRKRGHQKGVKHSYETRKKMSGAYKARFA